MFGGLPPGASILVNLVLVPVRAQMKYLSLILGGRRLFEEHFRQLALKRLWPIFGWSQLRNKKRLHRGCPVNGVWCTCKDGGSDLPE